MSTFGILYKAGADKESINLFETLASHNEIGYIKIMINNGFDINTKNNGVYLLHECVTTNREFIARFLIGHGADINVTDDNGNTMLHKIALSGNRVMYNFCIRKGANPNTLNNIGLTASKMFT